MYFLMPHKILKINLIICKNKFKAVDPCDLKLWLTDMNFFYHHHPVYAKKKISLKSLIVILIYALFSKSFKRHAVLSRWTSFYGGFSEPRWNFNFRPQHKGKPDSK